MDLNKLTTIIISTLTETEEDIKRVARTAERVIRITLQVIALIAPEAGISTTDEQSRTLKNSLMVQKIKERIECERDQAHSSGVS